MASYAWVKHVIHELHTNLTRYIRVKRDPSALNTIKMRVLYEFYTSCTRVKDDLLFDKTVPFDGTHIQHRYHVNSVDLSSIEAEK